MRSAVQIRAGEVVAGHRIERVLGRGGSATVYQAQREPWGQVALKIMHEQDPSGVTRQRFVREAALVQRLVHPNVVRMFEYGHTEASLPYITFELLAGQSLKSALRDGPMSSERVRGIALQVLDAVTSAHALGIIHRDIKPANVFLCESNQGDRVSVLDFGLAKAMEGELPESTPLTRTGHRLGTPRYMSPEMARAEPVGEPGDLYSLGLVMAELLAGRPMVEAQAQLDMLLAHASDNPLPLPDSVKKSPLGPTIERALAKSLAVRFRTAVQMRAQLDALGPRATSVQVPAPSPDAADMMPTAIFAPPAIPPERRAAAAALAAMPVAAPVALPAPLPPSAPLPPAPTVRASTVRHRSTRSGVSVWVVLLLVVVAVAAALASYLLA
jgi:eukaryotic-like serine/threonine-protein kinase